MAQGELSDEEKEEFLKTVRRLIDGLPQPEHGIRTTAFIEVVYRASDLTKEEFTQVLRNYLHLLHQVEVEVVIPGERLCDYCKHPGVLRTAPDSAMVCPRCLQILKIANLYSWRADEAGVPPIEVDDELLGILRRIYGIDTDDTEGEL